MRSAPTSQKKLKFPLPESFFPPIALQTDEIHYYEHKSREQLAKLLRIIDDVDCAYQWLSIRVNDGKSGTIQTATYTDSRNTTPTVYTTSVLYKSSFLIKDTNVEELMHAFTKPKTKAYRLLMSQIHGSAFLDGRTLFTFPASTSTVSNSSISYTSEHEISYRAVKWCGFRSTLSKENRSNASMDFIFLEYAGICTIPARGSTIAGFVVWQSMEQDQGVPHFAGLTRGELSQCGYLIQKTSEPKTFQVTAIAEVDGDIEPWSRQCLLDSIVRERLVGAMTKNLFQQRLDQARIARLMFKQQWQWVGNQDRKACACCTKAFRLLHRHKHHCRVCGDVVCATCAPPRTLPIEFALLKQVRICFNCMQTGSVVTRGSFASMSARVPLTKQPTWDHKANHVPMIAPPTSRQQEAQYMNRRDSMTSSPTSHSPEQLYMNRRSSLECSPTSHPHEELYMNRRSSLPRSPTSHPQDAYYINRRSSLPSIPTSHPQDAHYMNRRSSLPSTPTSHPHYLNRRSSMPSSPTSPRDKGHHTTQSPIAKPPTSHTQGAPLDRPPRRRTSYTRESTHKNQDPTTSSPARHTHETRYTNHAPVTSPPTSHPRNKRQYRQNSSTFSRSSDNDSISTTFRDNPLESVATLANLVEQVRTARHTLNTTVSSNQEDSYNDLYNQMDKLRNAVHAHQNNGQGRERQESVATSDNFYSENDEDEYEEKTDLPIQLYQSITHMAFDAAIATRNEGARVLWFENQSDLDTTIILPHSLSEHDGEKWKLSGPKKTSHVWDLEQKIQDLEFELERARQRLSFYEGYDSALDEPDAEREPLGHTGQSRGNRPNKRH